MMACYNIAPHDLSLAVAPDYDTKQYSIVLITIIISRSNLRIIEIIICAT